VAENVRKICSLCGDWEAVRERERKKERERERERERELISPSKATLNDLTSSHLLKVPLPPSGITG
jgi:hypothetical protein